MSPGKFVTFEGGEGVGKTTLISHLKNAAAISDLSVHFTREPGGSPRAEALRNVLLSAADAIAPMCTETEALIICAARSDHVDQNIRPRLDAGGHVFCDRYSDSTRAYQGGLIANDKLESLLSLAERGTVPDLTFLLDASPEQMLQRREKREQSRDRFEARDLDFHTKVRERFLSIAEQNGDRIIVVDADQPENDVLRIVLEALEERLGICLTSPTGSDPC